jgi:Flp pilus assembly protein CpaB
VVELTSPSAPRVRQPRWLDTRLVLGVLLILVSVVVAANVVRAADKSIQVWKTTRALAAGAVLTADDVVSTRVRLFGDDRARYVDASRGAHPEGLVLARDLGVGELLPAAALVEPTTAPPTRLVTVPVSQSHALGGRLRRGDRVDVIATYRLGAQGSETTPIIKAALIDEVLDTDAGFGAGDGYAVILQVSPQIALRLASAIQTAEIDLLLVQGSPGRSGDIGDAPVSGGPARRPTPTPSR